MPNLRHGGAFFAFLIPVLVLLAPGCSRNDNPAVSKVSTPATSTSTQIPVTPENFIRAESDRYFFTLQQVAGGVNKFNFGRSMLSLNEQNVIRMNRDTLYGAAVIDTQGGATITFPEIPDGRYASVLIIDNDHYAPMVIYEPGVHQLPQRTRYVVAAVRVHLRDPKDPEELSLVNNLQDQFKITAASAEPFPKPNWDGVSLDNLRAQYETEIIKYDIYPSGWMGPPGQVDESTRHLAAAGGWGLFPNEHALYINFKKDLPPNTCYRATYTVPENNAFWSITVYGDDGYIKSEQGVLAGYNTKFNPDGTFTAHFGSQELCGDVENRVDITEGWNFLMRVYRPGDSVLRGEYKLPTPKPVK